MTNPQRNINQNHNETLLCSCRMAVIKKAKGNKHWQRFVEKGSLVHSSWARKLVQPLRKTVQRFLIDR